MFAASGGPLASFAGGTNPHGMFDHLLPPPTSTPTTVTTETSQVISSTVQDILDHVTAYVNVQTSSVPPGTISMATASSSSVPSSRGSHQRHFMSQGVTADLDRQKRTVPVRVDECMLSLLIKLHAKLSGAAYVPPACRQGAAASATKNARIGDGAHFVAGVLDKVCERNANCAQIIENIYRESLPKESPEGVDGREVSGREER